MKFLFQCNVNSGGHVRYYVKCSCWQSKPLIFPVRNLCNKHHGMYCPVFGVVHIKDPFLVSSLAVLMVLYHMPKAI